MAKRIPSLNWLRVFEAAARTGSFARAAERLAMSPPAVSQQIRSLEAHLGTALFVRAAAGVTLTEAGRSLLVVVGEALGRMEAAAEALANPAGPPLIVGASLTLSAGWLAPRLNAFTAAYPDIRLQLRALIGHPETPPREAALWIGFGQPPPGTESLPLFGEWLQPVAHPEVAASIRDLRDLAQQHLIEVSDHRRNWAHVLGVDVLPQTARVTQVDTTAMALSLARSGLGVALARPPASDDLVHSLGLVPCVQGLRIEGAERYHVMWPSGVALDPAAARFRSWVCAAAKDAHSP